MPIWDIIGRRPGRGGSIAVDQDSLWPCTRDTDPIHMLSRARVSAHSVKSVWVSVLDGLLITCLCIVCRNAYSNRGGHTANSCKCPHKSIMRCPVCMNSTQQQIKGAVYTVASALLLLHTLSFKGKILRAEVTSLKCQT